MTNITDIDEAAYTIKRILAIRDGKKVQIQRRQYAQKCPHGWKHDENGVCVKMSPDELRARQKAGRNSWRSSQSRRAHQISMQRHKVLIPT